MRVGCSHGGQYVKDDYSGEFTKPNKELDLEDLFNRPGASGFQERGRERESDKGRWEGTGGSGVIAQVRANDERKRYK